ncbi:MAG TPA: [FeFe] hydrogenase H-cluster maturation GTPase HydF [Alkalispirochaeta sp.]|nr:[FeFe] hydrogenase H-cluster maturation GTPase HydF [Alkalispirochaeta sp.]
MTNRPQSTPRALRPHIVLVGKCNAGKSALLNALAGDDLAIVSATAGTTTDPVTRASELVPWGPVVYVDTAGSDDESALGAQRGSKAARAVSGADVVVYVFRPGTWDQRDRAEVKRLKEMSLPVIVVATHADLPVDDREPASREPSSQDVIHVGSPTGLGIAQLREHLIVVLSTQNDTQKTLLEDLVRPYRVIMLVVPIDLEAPAGRLIMPQVQTIREALDGDAMTVVVKEREITWALQQLSRPPDLVITDSQVVLKAAGAVPPSIPLTTFSILFSRFKGDLPLFVENVGRIDSLNHGSRILVTESCSHHAHCDDIARVKIPRWLRQYTGKDLEIDVTGGSIPERLDGYELVVHCGGCSITRSQMKSRIGEARAVNAPMTNYGVTISYLHGLLDRVLEPFNS